MFEVVVVFVAHCIINHCSRFPSVKHLLILTRTRAWQHERHEIVLNIFVHLLSAAIASWWLGALWQVSNKEAELKPPYWSWWSSRISSIAFLRLAFAFTVTSLTSSCDKHLLKCFGRQMSSWVKELQIFVVKPSSAHFSNCFRESYQEQ